MTRLKILFLVVVVLVSVKCTFFEDKSKKEEQLEFVEYVTNTEEPTVYTDCHSFRDSMIHQAKNNWKPFVIYRQFICIQYR